MRSNGKGFLTRALMLAMATFLALPAVTLAQGRGHGRNKNDVFVNGHDARDGRYDGRGPRRDDDRRDDDQWRRDRRRDRRDRDRDYDRDDEYTRRQQQRNDGYGNYGGYGNRGYGNYGNYGRYGGYTQSQQTALNAGYNEGVKEGRKDRSRGTYHDLEDFGAYRKATTDYNSRIGDRYEYQQYYRQGFSNGYRDGLNGY